MKISVAFCTYNGGRFLKEQLQSIFQQSVPVNEIIICDDRSKDNTVKIVNEFDLKYPGVIKLFINEKNLGSKYNFEKAISLASGDIIFLSDQDDIWIDRKVETVLAEFSNHENALMIFTNGDLIDENGNSLNSTLWDKWDFNTAMRETWKENKNAYLDLLQNNNKVTGATVAIKKELKLDILPFQLTEDLWHDAWMAMNAAKKNGLYFIDQLLVHYRVHPGQLVGIGNGKIFNTNAQSNTFFIKQKRRVLNLINKFNSLLK